VLKCLIFF